MHAPSAHGCVALDAFNLLPAGVLVLHGDGRIMTCNPEAGRILGRSPDTLKSASVDDVLVPVREVVKLARGRGRGEALIQTPAGERLVGYTVAYGDASAPLLILCQDLSGVRTLRDERDRLLRLATVGEVLPTVLHELRNPLAAVTSAMEVLVDETTEGLEPADLQATLYSVLHELRRMSLVFQGIGIVGRDLRSSRHGAIDLAVSEAVRIMGPRAERTEVGLAVNCRTMPLLPFDPSVVRAVVFNLVNNALQACDRGQRVVISADFDAALGLTIEVADTGRGMDPDELAQCTRAFFTTRPNGSGLGLVICREAVEEAGGTFKIESRLGVGTTVTVNVPLEPPMETL